MRHLPIVMMTHEAREKDLRKALAEIDKLPVVGEKTVFITIEEGLNLRSEDIYLTSSKGVSGT